MIRAIKHWWYEKVTKPRREYAKFVATCKKEQDYVRSHRPEPMSYAVYDLQEGMLPKEYWKIQPKATGKHFHDHVWPKSKIKR